MRVRSFFSVIMGDFSDLISIARSSYAGVCLTAVRQDIPKRMPEGGLHEAVVKTTGCNSPKSQVRILPYIKSDVCRFGRKVIATSMKYVPKRVQNLYSGCPVPGVHPPFGTSRTVRQALHSGGYRRREKKARAPTSAFHPPAQAPVRPRTGTAIPLFILLF